MNEPVFGLTPPPAPRPVIPLEPEAVPPAIPAAMVPPPLPAAQGMIAAPAPAYVPPRADGPYYKPPMFFRTEEPQPAAGGGRFAVWGLAGVLILMIGLGLGFLVALRVGPNRAGAKAPPPPAWKPIAPPAAVAPRAAPAAAPAPGPGPAPTVPVRVPSPRPPVPQPARAQAPATRPGAGPLRIPAPKPTAPVGDPLKLLAQMNLEMVNPADPASCVINDRLYRPGDSVNGMMLVAVAPAGVTLRHGDQRFELKLSRP